MDYRESNSLLLLLTWHKPLLIAQSIGIYSFYKSVKIEYINGHINWLVFSQQNFIHKTLPLSLNQSISTLLLLLPMTVVQRQGKLIVPPSATWTCLPIEQMPTSKQKYDYKQHHQVSISTQMYDRKNENALGQGSFFMFFLEREGVKDYLLQ